MLFRSAVTAQKMMVLNDVVEREDSLLTFNVDNLYAPEQEMPQIYWIH